MKKTLIIILVILLSFSFAFAKKAKKKKKPKPITESVQIIQGLERHGIKGDAAKEGVLAKVFKGIGMRDYIGIVGDRYSVSVWTFDTSFGFGVANSLFKMLSLAQDRYVYKEIPFIISIEADTKPDAEKVIKKLKLIMPHIREIGEDEK